VHPCPLCHETKLYDDLLLTRAVLGELSFILGEDFPLVRFGQARFNRPRSTLRRHIGCDAFTVKLAQPASHEHLLAKK
jgi:hypothetical protein